jgi:hypothetical protein
LQRSGKPPITTAFRQPTRPDTERGRSSGVEHDLAKVGVEGSNPFARSNFLPVVATVRAAFADSADCPGLDEAAAFSVLTPQPSRLRPRRSIPEDR